MQDVLGHKHMPSICQLNASQQPLVEALLVPKDADSVAPLCGRTWSGASSAPCSQTCFSYKYSLEQSQIAISTARMKHPHARAAAACLMARSEYRCKHVGTRPRNPEELVAHFKRCISECCEGQPNIKLVLASSEMSARRRRHCLLWKAFQATSNVLPLMFAFIFNKPDFQKPQLIHLAHTCCQCSWIER